MQASLLLLAFVTAQRLTELVMARRNTRALLAQGAIETGASHYPVMVLLHGSWLLGLWWFGFGAAVIWPLVVLYGLLQMFRLWILLTLGRRWTTRILTVPGEQLVAKGPYRFMRHPNYVLVALEMPLLPLALGLNGFALLFGILNLAMLAWRIHVENAALRPSR